MKNTLSTIIKGNIFVWSGVLLLMLFSILSIISAASTGYYLSSVSNFKLTALALLGIGFMLMLLIKSFKININKNLINTLFLITTLLYIIEIFLFPSINNISEPLFRIFRPGFSYFFAFFAIAKMSSVLGIKEEKESLSWKKLIIALAISLSTISLLMMTNIIIGLIFMLISSVMLLFSKSEIKKKLLFAAGVYVLTAVLLVTIFTVKYYHVNDFQTIAENRIHTYLSLTSHAEFHSKYIAEPIYDAMPFGKGIGKGEIGKVIPGAYNKLSFSTLLEEYGIISAGLILLAFALIIVTVINNALRKRRNSVSMFLLGTASLLFFQTAFHIFANFGLLPMFFCSLPMISINPSLLLITFFILGLFLKGIVEVEN